MVQIDSLTSSGAASAGRGGAPRSSKVWGFSRRVVGELLGSSTAQWPVFLLE